MDLNVHQEGKGPLDEALGDGTRVSGTFLRALGRPFVAAHKLFYEILGLLLASFSALFRGKLSVKALLYQAYDMGNRSVIFVLMTLGVLGFIAVFQVALQIERILPDFTMLGAAFMQMMWREFAPTVTGLMVATKVGSGIAAEIGSMVVTEQVDALRMSKADPVEYLVAPRMVAGGVMMMVLTVLGVLAASLAGMWVAKTGFDVSYATFLNFSLLKPKDIVIGLTKAASFGLIIPILAARSGLAAKGGSAGVGQATTEAVVHGSFAVILLDFLWSGIFFLTIDGRAG